MSAPRARRGSGIERSGPDAMRIGSLLKALGTTPDAKLATFAEQKCPKAGKGDAARVGRARDLLDAIGEALESSEEGPWLRVETAWRVAIEGTSEMRAGADLAKAEAAARGVPRERLAPPGVPRAPEAAGATRAEGPASPPKPPSVFSQEPLADADTPMPARPPSPWVHPTAATRRDDKVAPVAFAAVPSVDETQGVDENRLLLEALPFKGTAEPPPPGAALADLPPIPPDDLDGTSVMGRALSLDETIPFLGARSLRKELAAEAALRGRTPAEPAAPPPAAAPVARPAEARAAEPAELTLEQFAALCATCEIEPERTAAVERQYGVPTSEARRALDARWTARFRADGALYRSFYARFHEYRGWLLARRGPSR
ncbi:MAG: hypothetical protein HY908_27240 [Myxococcales bacterium]|nr:hypothetical protein [Myxococcales bacterium]